MTDSRFTDTSRRSFFLRGSVALGAGLASAGALASPWVFDGSLPLKEQVSRLQQQLKTLEDREALRQLYMSYTTLMENQAYEAVVELFAEDATVQLDSIAHSGKQRAIRQLFTRQYARQEAAQMQTAFVPGQQPDSIEISEDRAHARACFHARVRIDRPIKDDSVLGHMARLQGLSSETRWQPGRFELGYMREHEQWKISELVFQTDQML